MKVCWMCKRTEVQVKEELAYKDEDGTCNKWFRADADWILAKDVCPICRTIIFEVMSENVDDEWFQTSIDEIVLGTLDTLKLKVEFEREE